MAKTKVNTQIAFDPAPNVALTEKEGSRLIGILKKKVESTVYPGNFSYLIAVEDTDAPTRLYDKETETLNDVDVEEGEAVWLKGTSVLNTAFGQIEEGQKVEIIYTGKGEKKQGRKAPFLFDVFKVEK